ncbi:NIPA-like protein 2 [Lamellibrachia satsuma]|nr:NIPA-like protein 2 [Lamellibrachia satsuma]
MPLWWLGFILMVLGEVGNFSAYGFAPASLVAPLGTTTVIANMFIAVGILKERLRPTDIFGCCMAVVGAFLLVNFSTRTEKVLDADGIVEHLQKLSFIIYICTEVAVLTALFIVKLKFHVDSVLVLILITAILASFTVISAKAVSGMLQLTMAGSLQVHYAIFWLLLVVMVVTGVTQVKFLNQAMQLFDSTTVVPTNFVFFTISAILAGKSVIFTTSAILAGNATFAGKSVIFTTSAILAGKSVIFTTSVILTGKSIIFTTSATLAGKSIIFTTSAILAGKSVIFTTSAILAGKPVIFTTSAILAGKSVIFTTSATLAGKYVIFTTNSILVSKYVFFTISAILDGKSIFFTISAILDGKYVIFAITVILAGNAILAGKSVIFAITVILAGKYVIFTTNSILVSKYVFFTISAILDGKSIFFTISAIFDGKYVFFTTSAILNGIIFYNEFWGMTPFDMFMFLLGCVLCFIGVYFITAGRVAESADLASVSTVQVPSVQVPQSSLSNYTDVIPSWLLSPLSQQEVQPRRRDSGHNILASTEQQPFISWDDDSGTIQEVSTPDTLQGTQSPRSDTKSPSNDTVVNYGATDSR